MKGIASMFAGLLAIVMGIITFSTILASNVFESYTITSQSLKERILINAINEIALVKNSLKNALEYSFYQSLYSVSRKGGFVSLDEKTVNCIPYWREYDKTNFPRFKKNIQKVLLKVFNLYASNLGNKIRIPNFEEVGIREVDEKVEVIVSADENISFETSFLKIYENSKIAKNFSNNFFELYEVGRNNFISSDKIKDAIIASANNLPERCKKIEIEKSCSLPNPYQIHSNYCNDWKSIFEDEIENKILEIERRDRILLELDIKEVETNYAGNCDYNSQPSEECGIKICENETATYDCKCSEEPCCINYTRIEYCLAYQDIKCNYQYFGAARVLVKISDNSKKYPVYDPEEGTTAYRNVILRFYVVSGNKELIEPKMDESCRCERDEDCGECGFDECEGNYACEQNFCTFDCNSYGRSCNWIKCNEEYEYPCGSCDLAGECQVGRGCFGAEDQCCSEGYCYPGLICCEDNVCRYTC